MICFGGMNVALVSIAFIAGVVAETFLPLGWYFAVCVALVGIVLAVAPIHIHKTVLIALFALAFGIIRMSIAVEASHQYTQLFTVGEQVSLTGTIVDNPDRRQTATLLTVRVVRRGVPTKLLLFTGPYTQYHYGDTLAFEGVIEQPKQIMSDDGRVFDYRAFLRKDGIYFVVARPHITRVQEGFAWYDIYGYLFALKARYLQHLAEFIPEPESALAGGITVGDKQSLGKELKHDFRITGIIHIVVLSGYNIALIASFLFFLFGFFETRIAFVLSVLCIVLFAVMTGGGASIVRASAMGVLSLVAVQMGRTYAIMRALLIVAVVMVLWNPWIVVYDIAFQLSFMATLGLIVLYPILYERLHFLPRVVHIDEVVVATLSAQIAVLPLIIYYMGDISFVALFVNILVVPLVPVAMLLVFLVGSSGFVSATVASVFAYSAYALLHLIFMIVFFFKQVPGALVHVKPFSFVFVLVAYGVLGAWVLQKRRASAALQNDT